PTTISLSISTRPPTSTLFPYTTLFRSLRVILQDAQSIPRSGLTRLDRRCTAEISLSASDDLAGLVLVRNVATSNAIELQRAAHRSEEHTSELQSPDHLVCRLLLEKKKH